MNDLNHASVVTIGNELLEGRVQDTNSTLICRLLTENNFSVVRKITAGDSIEDIKAALAAASTGADTIIVTGGLGPTEDDRTAEAAAEFFGVSLRPDAATENKIRTFYENLSLPFAEIALKQGLLIDGAEIIENTTGTAPGMLFIRDDRRFAFFPGVPRELEAMLHGAVRKLAGDAPGAIRKLSFKTFGAGETQIQKMLPAELVRSANPALAFLPGRFEVELRLTARADAPEAADALITTAAAAIRAALADLIYGENDVTLEETAVRLLRERRLSIACAESCTGGLIASRIVSVPGASETLRGAVVAYTPAAKRALLGVPDEVLTAHGAVSAQTASEMATRVRVLFGADVGVAAVGNAGPTAEPGGAEVGRVYVAAALGAGAPEVVTRKILRPRNDVRFIASQIALDLIRRIAAR